MVDIHLLKNVHRLKELGLNDTQIGKQLGICRATVGKYRNIPLSQRVTDIGNQPEQKPIDGRRLLDVLSRLELKVDELYKNRNIPVLPVVETSTSAVLKTKEMNWRDYVGSGESSTGHSSDDEYLNKLVERGYSADYVRDRAIEKGLLKVDEEED